MQPNEQQPGWQYTPDDGKKTEPGTLSIDHSQKKAQKPSEPETSEILPEAPPLSQPESSEEQPAEPEPQATAAIQPLPEPPVNNAVSPSQEVAWTASEYIHHERGTSWYAALFIIAISVSAVTYLITKDVATSVIFVILAAIVAGFASRKPSNIEYRVASDGVHIGPKFYAFNLFKSFSIIQDEGLKSIMLIPLKRFMPPVSMYFAPNDEQKIVEILGDRLPQAQAKPEAVDRLARRLKL